MDTSVKRVKKDKLQQTIDDCKVEGFELKSESENVAILVKYGGWGSLFGHFLVFLFTGWFSFGICNLIYAAYVHYSRDKKELQIKVENTEEPVLV